MIQLAARNTPEWWADRLLRKLNERKSKLERLERYYDGATPLAYATSRFREEFGSLLQAINDNWCQLVVGAVDERLKVEGFRIAGSDEADANAWRVWTANRMQEDSQIGHTESLKLGDAYVIVWQPSTDQDAIPVITVEHPLQVYVELDPANRSNRLAAIKAWRDEVEGQCVTVYLPTGIHKLRRGQKGWEAREVPGEEYPLPNPWGVVPVVPLSNRPGLLRESASEIENILSKQDMVNKLWADMIIAAEYGAFRQRWATGVEIPKGPDGNEIMSFEASMDRLWHTHDDKAKFGEFEQTDLEPYVKAIEKLVQHIASQTATPPHYLLTSGQMPSGESLRAAEAPLVAKARRKQNIYGSAWSEVMRLALLMMNSEIEQGAVIETLWADPETRTESEHVDAVTKMKALDLPSQVLWEMIGLTPSEVERAKRLRVDDALSAALAAPVAPAPSSAAGTPAATAA